MKQIVSFTVPDAHLTAPTSRSSNRTSNQKPTIETTKITGNIIQAWTYCKLLTMPHVLRKDDGIARFFNENRAAEFIGNMEEAKAPFSWERLVEGLEKVGLE